MIAVKDKNQPTEDARMKRRYIDIAADNITALQPHFSALAHPLKYIDVPPRAIEYHCSHHFRTRKELGAKLYDWGKVMDGDWDLETPDKMRTSQLADMMKERYITGTAWEDTKLFAHKISRIAARGKIDGCHSREELYQRYLRLDAIYAHTRETGRLLTAQERGMRPTDDLFVSIGRHGQFLFAHGGNHRLALSQVMDLPTIPTRVVMRHRAWQDVREAAKKGHIPTAYQNHPDLAEFINHD